MTFSTFEISVPSKLLEFGFDQNRVQQAVSEWLALSLFTDGYVSSGKAAQLLNINRMEFLSLLRKRGMAYIDFTPEELKEELETVNQLFVDETK